MAENSKIEWCDHTFNPWEGCTKVSPGCANCYAEARNKRWGNDNWGKGKPRRRQSEATWKQPLKWNRTAFSICPDCGNDMLAILQRGSGIPLEIEMCGCGSTTPPTTLRRPRVFCASLADWLDDEAPIEWLADLLKLIHATPNLDWLLLTKRPEYFKTRMHMVNLSQPEHGFDESLVGLVSRWIDGFAPENVWIGTTTENQRYAEKRIPELLKIPAKVRFLSCEPLLGPVDLTRVHFPTGAIENVFHDQAVFRNTGQVLPLNSVKWVICGGESGRAARPMHSDWARDLRDQCQSAGVPFFFKQWGEWLPRLEGSGAEVFYRVGKKAAGRLLDGREWNEVPR
jgi:protein gp37